MISVFGILVVCSLLTGHVLSAARDPIIKQFEVDEHNNVIRPYEIRDEYRSQIIVEKLGNLRLECHADYPVQWIYTGNGIPIMKTDISLATSSSTTDRRKNHSNYQYVASAFLDFLSEYHTGKYDCSRTEYLSSNGPSLYIYVTGQNLFPSTLGKTIRINRDEASFLIPCTVSDPRIEVSLYKFEGGAWRKPVTRADDAITYDPRKGFSIYRNKVKNVEGRYQCRAYNNNGVRDVEYKVTSSTESEEGQLNTSPNDDRTRQQHNETCVGDSCNKQCSTHTDCPSNMHCYVDLKCRDPCDYSIRCGIAAMCRLVEDRPQCYCPFGFIGDAAKECFNIRRERYP